MMMQGLRGLTGLRLGRVSLGGLARTDRLTKEVCQNAASVHIIEQD